MEHTFTANIKQILENHFGVHASDIFEKSQLLQYLNDKTRSANRGSKSRGSFATLYSIYVIIEDYIQKEFNISNTYSQYEGAAFSSLLKRARELPFGNKIQNHAFNNRVNKEFNNRYHNEIPIIQNINKRYWINENLLQISIGVEIYNLAPVIIEIIDEYTKTKQDSFQRFIKNCEQLQAMEHSEPEKVVEFVKGLLAPNVDARLFEIVSYSILKYFYQDKIIYWGFEKDDLNEENLKLYKTGRTNANDGGIDFVMRPIGRFFQVTETLDFKKYFLDIDKIQKFPITFVIKSEEDIEVLSKKIENNANKIYSISLIVNKYMECIEEIINIPKLQDCFEATIANGHLNDVLREIIMQSKVEFNYVEI